MNCAAKRGETRPHWMTLLLGQPLELAALTEVAQLPLARAAYDLSVVNADPPPVGEFGTVTLRERRTGALTAEVYHPAGAGPWPVLLYLHGGGWCLGSPASVRRLAMELALAGYVVVNLDYRLAPEHPFPAAVEDCLFAARWLTSHGHELGGDGGPLTLAGDSAGANLAAAVVLAARSDGALAAELDAGPPQAVEFASALLLYGVYDFPLMMLEPGANQGGVEVAFNLAYLGTHFLRHHRHPLVSAAYGDLRGFPPTYLSCGAQDALLGQSLGMAQALARADVAVTLSVVAGLDHCFAQLDRHFAQARAELERAVHWLGAQALEGSARHAL